MYSLKITKRQADIIIQSLDLFSRVGCGQFDALLRHPTWAQRQMKGVFTGHEARDLIESVKKCITGFASGVSEGITVSDEHNRIAYDILQVIRNRIMIDEKRKGKPVIDFMEPMRWADHPLAEISEE